MNKSVEHIVFDLGGVLLNIDLGRIWTGFGEIMIESEEGKKLVMEKIVPDYETGRINTEGFLQALEPYLKKGRSRNEIVEIWNSIFIDFPAERLEMLRELRKNHKVHLLSNINDMHALKFEENFSKWFNEDPRIYFDHFFYSHHIGKRKPDKATFEWVINQLNSTPQSIVFIDDLLENVMGARETGINAQHLDLKERNVIELMKDLGYLK